MLHSCQVEYKIWFLPHVCSESFHLIKARGIFNGCILLTPDQLWCPKPIPISPPGPSLWLRRDQYGEGSEATGTYCWLTLTVRGDGCESVDCAVLGLRCTLAAAHAYGLPSVLQVPSSIVQRGEHTVRRKQRQTKARHRRVERGLACCEPPLKLMKHPWNSFHAWETQTRKIPKCRKSLLFWCTKRITSYNSQHVWVTFVDIAECRVNLKPH